VLASTWALTDDLVGKYADGGEAAPRAGLERRQAVAVSNLGYSSEWLAAAGFDSGPARIEGHIAAEATPGWLERQQLLGRTEPAVAAVALPAPSLRGADTEAQRQDAARAPQTLRVVAVLAFAAAVVAAAAVAAAVRRVAASTRAVLPLAVRREWSIQRLHPCLTVHRCDWCRTAPSTNKSRRGKRRARARRHRPHAGQFLSLCTRVHRSA